MLTINVTIFCNGKRQKVINMWKSKGEDKARERERERERENERDRERERERGGGGSGKKRCLSDILAPHAQSTRYIVRDLIEAGEEKKNKKNN